MIFFLINFYNPEFEAAYLLVLRAGGAEDCFDIFLYIRCDGYETGERIVEYIIPEEAVVAPVGKSVDDGRVGSFHCCDPAGKASLAERRFIGLVAGFC